jgi:hypothetical protein
MLKAFDFVVNAIVWGIVAAIVAGMALCVLAQVVDWLVAIRHLLRKQQKPLQEPEFMSDYKPESDSELEDRAKQMAEYYMGHREKMGDDGIRACMRRVAQENPKLHRFLQHELTEYIRSENRKPK